ncbi:MAG: BCD family MFS transporter [Roseiflexaceae bacterium]|nr:BCD family MFS transporter [Roseiflexaceae bacterium]
METGEQMRANPLRLLRKPAMALRRWLAHHEQVAFWLQVLRLGLFQFGMGISLAPLVGTLNRVLIDELHIPAVSVGFLIAIHYFVSPVRALIGFRSDQNRAQGRWRTPYIVLGAMLTYGGLSTAPFSLIVLGSTSLPFWQGMIICTLIFLVYGIGVNIVETTYLALVSDITPPQERGKVLATLWMMLVLGTVVSSLIVGQLLIVYSHNMLIRVMQGSAVLFIAMTFLALFGREKMRPDGTLITVHEIATVRMSLGQSLRTLWAQRTLRTLFGILFIATLAFATHDVLLEPYGGQVLNMSVSATTQLTALWGVAMIAAIVIAGILLWQGGKPALPILIGCAVGALGFLVISLASNEANVTMFRMGVALIGMGRGLFIVGSVAIVMTLADRNHAGLFMGLWGVMQALAQGFGAIGGGLARDIAEQVTGNVALGYVVVYATSLGLLVLALVLIGAMRLGRQIADGAARSPWAGLQDVPADQLIA